jgi:hypothetical protein
MGGKWDQFKEHRPLVETIVRKILPNLFVANGWCAIPEFGDKSKWS